LRSTSFNIERMNIDSHDSRLFLVKRAAELRGIYPPRLWRAIRRGQVPAYRIGAWLRVRLEDVDHWIDSQKFVPLRSRHSGGADQ
jgi:excisionase family DNA binding protein